MNNASAELKRRLYSYKYRRDERYETKYLEDGVECFCWTCLARFRSKRQLFDHLEDKKSHMVDYKNIECCGNSFNVATKAGVSLLGYHLAFTKPCHTTCSDYSHIVCCGVDFGDNYDRYVFHLCNDRPRHDCHRSAMHHALDQSDHKMLKAAKVDQQEWICQHDYQRDCEPSPSAAANEETSDDDNDEIAHVSDIIDVIQNAASNPAKDLKTKLTFGTVSFELETKASCCSSPDNTLMTTPNVYSPAPPTAYSPAPPTTYSPARGIAELDSDDDSENYFDSSDNSSDNEEEDGSSDNEEEDGSSDNEEEDSSSDNEEEDGSSDNEEEDGSSSSNDDSEEKKGEGEEDDSSDNSSNDDSEEKKEEEGKEEAKKEAKKEDGYIIPPAKKQLYENELTSDDDSTLDC